MGAYSEVTNKIRVSVVPTPDGGEEAVREAVFPFKFQVTIENLSDEWVQLIERYCVVLSADRPIAEVVEPGVVGVQPFLNEGEMFQYEGGTVLCDPFGAMYGCFTFRTESGRFIQASIPRFELVDPHILH